MKRSLQILIVFLVMISAITCERQLYSNSETVLARVGEHYLYLSELAEGIPSNINSTDSIQMLNSMIDNWIRQELLLQHSNSNLPDSLKDFSEQLNIYENNLIIYEFKKRWVEQNMDTVVSREDIEIYYENHLKDFQLKENIVQFVFIKIPVQSEMVEQAKDLIKRIADTTVDRSMVADFCQQNALDYYLNDEKWNSFNDLVTKVPIETFNQEIYLKNNHFIEIKDHPFWYFVNLRDFKIKEDVSPLNFERDRIRNIILNKRKLDLLNSLEEDIFEDAATNQQFEIY